MSLRQRIALTKLETWLRLRPTIPVGRLRLPASPDVAPLIYRSADWKTDLIDRVLKLRKGAFVDVGANIGQTLIDYVEANERHGYIGFEPNLRCVDIVKDMIKSNNLRDARIIPTGLSHTSSIVPFYVRPDRAADTTATMVKEIRPDDPAEIIFVPVYPFDQVYAETLGSPPLSLIKIDVEGGELMVLRGMQRTLATEKPWILCEVLARDPYADPTEYIKRCTATMDVIVESDYRAYRVIKSRNDRRVITLKEIGVFPDAVYGPDTMHKCDYLIVPQADDVASLM